jgi:hypothetical protein
LDLSVLNRVYILFSLHRWFGAMTSFLEMTVEELTRKIKAIQDLGWIRTARRGPTGVGHTLEGLLGYSENNISIPDWGVFEIKATRKNQKNLITLFSKAPTRANGITPKSLVSNHGYWDEKKDRQALYVTIDACKRNNQGWILTIDTNEEKIEINHEGTVVASQDLKKLRELVAAKVTNLALILADSKVEGRDEFFHYNEAWLLANAELETLVNLIKNGFIVFDWRMHLKSSGQVRDHGPGYRVREDFLQKLYSRKKKLI